MKKHLLPLALMFLSLAGSAQVVYKDVAPIFISRCTSCHNPYGHFSMLNYSQTANYSAQIKNYLTNDIMPPWSPDTTYSRFTHERHISAVEKAAILSWISGGSLPGDTTLAQTPPSYTKYKLTGTPDLEIKAPVFTSNANTTDSYVCFSIPMGLTQGRILRAYEVVAGNPSIVHHVIVNIDTIGNTTSDLSGTCFTAPGSFGIGGYAPGAEPTVFPGKAPLIAGIKIKAGSKIILQLHYPMGTAGQIDSTKIRLYFYPLNATGIRPVFVTTPLQNWGLNIPANTIKTFSAHYPSSGGLPYAISIFAAFPHSHKVATSIVSYAYTAVDTVPLVRINNWDFNWQGFYTYKKLAVLTAGHTIFSQHVYDNTTNNPHNPNSPPKLVVAGTNTTDEMLFDSFQWLVYQPGDENIDVSALLAGDSLLSTGFKPQYISTSGDLKTYAYPNPFSHQVTIGYELDSPSAVSVEIYSIYGTKVMSLLSHADFAGTHMLTWDGKNALGATLPAGTYIYQLKAGGKQTSGKLMLRPE
jgi:hypothetical protein